MNQLPDHVLALARGRFHGFPESDLRVVPLEKGGSDRRFFRISTGEGQSMIVVSYSGHKEENKHYVDIGMFLASAGINVPGVFLHEPSQGLIFMQDLGEIDLWHWREAAWEIRKPLYEQTLDQALLLHGVASRLEASRELRLQLDFGEPLYLWEQDYFFQNCLNAYFGVKGDHLDNLASLTALRASAQQLAALPRTLIHRDFQSQNVLISGGHTWLIDFQGMRSGLPHYDLASLLYDPYVTLSQAEREHLTGYYLERASGQGIPIGDNFCEVLDLCAMQRLMQALGAYGFLGLKCSRPRFLDHIAPARTSLRSVVARLPGLEPLAETLDSLP